MFLGILENSQETTCARASFLIKLQASGSSTGVSFEFSEIPKNTFFHWTPSYDCFSVNNSRYTKSISKKTATPKYGKTDGLMLGTHTLMGSNTDAFKEFFVISREFGNLY